MEPEYFCLCMSPALDASVTLSAWPSDGVIFKDVAETENVGGKGINVARWLPPAVPKDFYAAAIRALKTTCSPTRRRWRSASRRKRSMSAVLCWDRTVP